MAMSVRTMQYSQYTSTKLCKITSATRETHSFKGEAVSAVLVGATDKDKVKVLEGTTVKDKVKIKVF